jgi:hypothetical protein
MSFEVKLKISREPLTPETHQNTFEMEVEYMHGDADGETTKTFLFNAKDDEDVERMKMFIAAYDANEDPDYLGDQATTFFKSIGIEDERAEELGQMFDDDFWEGDMTCEGNGASFAGLQLFFWDDNSQKFEVEFKIKK